VTLMTAALLYPRYEEQNGWSVCEAMIFDA
jgi:hypothetical protein